MIRQGSSLSNKILFSLGISILALLMWQLFNQPSPGYFKHTSTQKNQPETTGQSSAYFKADFASHHSTHEVHSATAIELNNNNVMAFWYGGSREGHKDVGIWQNTWDSSSQTWGQDTMVISRSFTRDTTSRYIRKLGNPVVTRGPDNSIWLFYVSVSVGGWAGSAINLTRSYDEGKSWSPAKRLITSPFLNLSTLIKGSAIHYTDNTIGLPVYHELLGKFGELLRLNTQGEVIDKVRLSWGKTSLQPIIFTTSASNAIALMRYQGPPPYRILTQSTQNAGLNWTTVEKTQLPNPGAGIIGLSLSQDNILLLAFNNDEEKREDMSLAISQDNGKTWKLAAVVDKKQPDIDGNDVQFSYPWLLQSQNGTIHLFYSWHKNAIKHVVFNTAWLHRNLP